MVSKTVPSRPRGWLLLVALLPLLLVLTWCSYDSQAYVRWTNDFGSGLFWPDSEATLNLRVGCPPNNRLTEYGPCWDDAARNAAQQWNAVGANFTFRIQSPSQPVDDPSCDTADGINTVVWADTYCGVAFGDNTLAIALSSFSLTGELVDSDVVFNANKDWSTYSGSLRSYARDFHRVAIHEFGHVLGLGHPDEHGQIVNAIMNSKVSNLDRIRADDIEGLRAIYDDSSGGLGDDHGDTRQEATEVGLPSATPGSLEETGDEDWFQFTVPQAGTLTVETTGSTDTDGTLYSASGRFLTSDYDSGSGDNFHIRREVSAGTHYVRVRGLFSTGSYTLRVRFTVVSDDHGDTRQEATKAGLPSDTQGTLEKRGDEDYFRLSILHSGTLTVETTGSTDTSGTLYTAEGRWLDSDYDSGRGDNFRISREVSAGTYYVRVSGFLTTGSYTLHARFTAGLDDDHGDSRQEATNIRLPSDTQGTLERASDEDYFRLSVPRSGTLTVETTGSTDTSGILYTADGFFLDFDFDSGSEDNFRIVHEVSAGTYYVEVSGFLTTGSYTLRASFSADDGGGNRGFLENPRPNAFKSGVGLISGWVCEAQRVEVDINGSRMTAVYGTDREDTRSQCGDADNGFVTLFNWNRLGNGRHTARLLVDGEEFSRSTFRVTTFGQEFLRGVKETITVPDFPRAGTTTVLEWEESTQNFVIREVR